MNPAKVSRAQGVGRYPQQHDAQGGKHDAWGERDVVRADWPDGRRPRPSQAISNVRITRL